MLSTFFCCCSRPQFLSANRHRITVRVNNGLTATDLDFILEMLYTDDLQLARCSENTDSLINIIRLSQSLSPRVLTIASCCLRFARTQLNKLFHSRFHVELLFISTCPIYFCSIM
jgi:hypothetical protein